MAKELSPHAATAAAIRQELKNKFPAYKFSVRSESFAGGDAVRISWENGPTNAEIELITGKYQMGHFKGMEDIYEYSNNNSNLPQSKYVTASRGYSEGLQNQIKMELESLYDFTNVSYRDSSENVAYRILSKTSFPAQYDSLKLVEFNDLEGNGIESFFKIDFSGVKVVEEKKTEATIQTDVKAEEIQVIEYSPKSFAVIGEKTKEIKEKLIELGGSYNRHLKCGAGFIFSNKRLGNVIEFLKSLKQVQEEEQLQEEEKTQEKTLKEVFKSLPIDAEVQKFDNLEDLEEAAKGGQIISLLNMFELVKDENKKSPECSQVLQLMDKDYTYTDAVNLVCQSSQIDKNNLEVQLNKYI